ncbi:hypothetical protein [Macrococcus animalis]|uniref:hypothetical protein n=1 Tax=Macrococcus animalis TaxID=3395467 RepID=UPI0039BDE094
MPFQKEAIDKALSLKQTGDKAKKSLFDFDGFVEVCRETALEMPFQKEAIELAFSPKNKGFEIILYLKTFFYFAKI